MKRQRNPQAYNTPQSNYYLRNTELVRERGKAFYRRDRLRQLALRRSRTQAFYKLINECKNVPCVDCGGDFPPYVMDFDHVRGEKLHGVAQMVGHALADVEAEIAKCEVVCSNCHRIRTNVRGQLKEAHAKGGRGRKKTDPMPESTTVIQLSFTFEK